MAWNGSGTFTRDNGENSGATTWADDAAAGTKITASNHDTHDEDIATAINACLTKNNETKPTAHFDPNAADTYDLGDATNTWRNLYASGDLVIKEQADHQVTPAATFGQFWVKDDAPCTPQFTDDAGNDLQLSGITLGTEQATTSGSDIDFTSIPAWAKTIKILFEDVSTDGTTNKSIQIGDSGGVEETGYTGGTMSFATAPTITSASGGTTGIFIASPAASDALTGCVELNLKDSANNTWVFSGVLYSPGAALKTIIVCGHKSLSGTLDRVRITCGSDAFDNGSINITYS